MKLIRSCEADVLLLKNMFTLLLILVLQIPLRSAEDTNSNKLANSSSDNEVKSRQKRFLYYTSDRRLAFPPGTGLAADLKISMPFQRGIPTGIDSATNLDFPLGFDFDTLRWTSDENPYFVLPFEEEVEEEPLRKRRKKRHLPYGGDRRMFYQMIEDYLSNIGMNGPSCLLRAICEAHELPFYSQGFFGEALRLLLTASFAAEIPDSIEVYLEAEKLGSSYQDCSQYKRKCHHTMFSSRTSDLKNATDTKNRGRFLYYSTDRRITFPPKTVGYFALTFYINNFRGAYTGTSMSMSVTAGVGMDFDALYLTSPDHPFAYVDTSVEVARRKRNAPDGLPAVSVAGGDRELMYPAVEEHLHKFGLNGKACLLRAICEAQEKPIKNYNFIGEILMHFLRPSKAFKPQKRLQEYLAAERSGKLEKNCKAYHTECPKSFFVDVPKFKIKRHPEATKYIKNFMKNIK